MPLATLGYEGLDTETFFNILNRNNIQTIIDIRELPISRKRGFSKTALSKQAEVHQLRYIHMSNFGAPRDIRHEYREDEDWDRFTERYLAHLRTQNTELEQLVDLIRNESCCLLCFEANHLRCHRRYVASALFARMDGELRINHLGVKETTPVVWRGPLVGIVNPR